MMTYQEFKMKYFPNKGVVEIKDKKQANDYFKSKMSCCWENTIIGGTGWAVICQSSPSKAGEKPNVLICKADLIDTI